MALLRYRKSSAFWKCECSWIANRYKCKRTSVVRWEERVVLRLFCFGSRHSTCIQIMTRADTTDTYMHIWEIASYFTIYVKAWKLVSESLRSTVR